jgi:hypothetical protein
VLIGFVWAGQVQASPLQIDLRASAAIAQQMAMTDCQPCASCYIGPPFAAHKADGGDHPGLVAVSAITRFVAQTDSSEFVADIPEVPTVALRFLYCRWLN